MSRKPKLYMVGVIADHLDESTDFYRRLGLEFSPGKGSHREADVDGLTMFLDGRPSVWHPGFADRPYQWLLEFYFDSLLGLEAKIDELAEAGYQILDRPYENGFGMWFAFVADPEGNTVLLSAEKQV